MRGRCPPGTWGPWVLFFCPLKGQKPGRPTAAKKRVNFQLTWRPLRTVLTLGFHRCLFPPGRLPRGRVSSSGKSPLSRSFPRGNQPCSVVTSVVPPRGVAVGEHALVRPLRGAQCENEGLEARMPHRKWGRGVQARAATGHFRPRTWLLQNSTRETRVITDVGCASWPRENMESALSRNGVAEA